MKQILSDTDRVHLDRLIAIPIATRILLVAFIFFGIIGLFTFLGIVTPDVGWFLYALSTAEAKRAHQNLSHTFGRIVLIEYL